MGGGLDDLLGGLLGGGDDGEREGGLGGMLGGGGGGMLAALAPMVIGMLANGGLQKILAQFQQQGMGGKAASWVGTGENEPVSPGEVRAALGDEQVAEAARQLGVSEDEAAAVLAQVLPATVDRVTPEGDVPDEGRLRLTLDDLRPGSS